jgi:hypothetical protein
MWEQAIVVALLPTGSYAVELAGDRKHTCESWSGVLAYLGMA